MSQEIEQSSPSPLENTQQQQEDNDDNNSSPFTNHDSQKESSLHHDLKVVNELQENVNQNDDLNDDNTKGDQSRKNHKEKDTKEETELQTKETKKEQPTHQQSVRSDENVDKYNLADKDIPPLPPIMRGELTAENREQLFAEYYEEGNDDNDEKPDQKDLDIQRSVQQLKNRNPPVMLEWKDVTYVVNIKKKFFRREKRQILYPMSGYVAPGEVLAILGPSGAGKTSLLNILTQVVKPTSGKLLANGKKVGKSLKSISAFVRQEDVLMGNLKVIENLRYAALLRLPTTVPIRAKFKMVDDLITELGLQKCRNTQVGFPGLSKGISGGEKKRLAIAVELITSPSILFLDEPTTGLDSKTALNIVETISKIAHNGRTVILTIHQPRSSIYTIFDKLLILSRGRTAYFGKAESAPEYFESIGYPVPPRYNPADFFIDIVAESTTEVTTEEAKLEQKKKDDKRINGILDGFEERCKTLEISPVEPPQELRKEEDPNVKKPPKYQSLWVAQTAILFTRGFINILRDRVLFFARLFQTIAFSVILSFIFFRLGDDQQGLQDRRGVLFFLVMNISFSSLFPQLIAFSTELSVFYRERSAKTYRVSSYLTAKWLAEIPFQVGFVLLFSCIVYYIIGLNPSIPRFLTFIGICQVLGFTASTLGQMLGSLSPNTGFAFAIAPLSITVLFLFGGFFLSPSSIGWWFIWIYWISPFHFGFEAFALNEFRGQTYTCTQSEIDANLCRERTGEVVLKNLEMDRTVSEVWINVCFLFLLIFVGRVVTYFGLRFLKKPKAG